MNAISNLWSSHSEIDWKNSLNNYWSYVRKENIELERNLNNLKISEIENLDKFEWYDFLFDKYFRWKYTAPNRYATTTKYLCRYKDLNQLDKLFDIKKRLLNNSVFDIKLGLSIAMEIKGLGIAGASGLLSLMYPDIYGTVDQFLVKALKNIQDLPKSDLFELQKIKLIKTKKPDDEIYDIKLENGIFLIDIMSRKAKSNNEIFGTNFWTPRKIDMILWSTRDK
jgi:hypothetical protein